VSRPDTVLPIEVRQAAWQRLWQRLLADPPIPDDTLECEPREQPDDELAAKDSEAA
jgi:hypothetical protein